ncbi:unnamed protein product [Blepharisma stoltei]|uniref:Protein YIPF n=1 Tax=Blepharisma stoltei TaxID=1481888 RepID=A0AAU9JYW3_9CILI|nr:unnamed protein product [Blepharisma stoltei]
MENQADYNQEPKGFDMINLESDRDEPAKLSPPTQFEGFQNQNLGQQIQTPRKARCWELEYFKPFFDVDSVTVFYRIRKAILPWQTSTFFEDKLPDLYCPFWTATTLIFLLAAAGNFSTDNPFEPHKLVTGIALVYSLVFLIPTICYFILSHSGSQVKFLELLSIYGYSYVIFLPTVLLCAIPSSVFRWVLMSLAAVWSGILLVKNYWNEIEIMSQVAKIGVGVIGLGGHITIMLMANLYFFE